MPVKLCNTRGCNTPTKTLYCKACALAIQTRAGKRKGRRTPLPVARQATRPTEDDIRRQEMQEWMDRRTRELMG
jgi:hypothetical protein